jgi:hypothetical protein
VFQTRYFSEYLVAHGIVPGATGSVARKWSLDHKDDIIEAMFKTSSNAQNYWVSGLYPSSGVSGRRNTTFRKLDLFPSSGEGGKKTRTQLGPLERVNPNHNLFKEPN